MRLEVSLHSETIISLEERTRRVWRMDKSATVPSVEVVLMTTPVPHVLARAPIGAYNKHRNTFEALGFMVIKHIVCPTGMRNKLSVVQTAKE